MCRSMSQLASLSACQTPFRSGLTPPGPRGAFHGSSAGGGASQAATANASSAMRDRLPHGVSPGLAVFLDPLGLQHPGAAQRVRHRVVAFVAGVLVEPLVALVPRELAGVGRLVVRVVHGEAVQQAVTVDGAEALDDLQSRARIVRRHEVAEIGRLDDQRVAFPPADGVAAVGDHVVRQVFRVEPDDARPVHPLDHDQHLVVGLHDGLHVVVRRGRRRHRQRHVDAAIADGHVLGVVVRIAAFGKPPGFARILGLVVGPQARAAFPARFRDGGPPAIRRIDDDRRPVLAVDLEVVAVLAAAVEPEPVVAAGRVGPGTVDATLPGLTFKCFQALAVGVRGCRRLVHP